MLQTFSKGLFSIKIFSAVFFRLLLGIALSSYYGLHTGKEGADRKGVLLRGLAPFLGHFSDQAWIAAEEFPFHKVSVWERYRTYWHKSGSKDEKDISRRRTPEWQK